MTPIPDQVLEQVDVYLPEARWRPLLRCQTSNQLFESVFRGQRYVLRVNAPASLAFGADRLREAAVLELINPCRWAPRVLSCSPDRDKGFCLMQYHGEPPDHTETSLKGVVTALADMQSFRSGPVLDYGSLVNLYSGMTAGNPAGRDLLVHLQACLQKLPDDRCLVHHDLHPGNVVMRHGHMVILDWEYAGIASPWLDMAKLIEYWQPQPELLRQLPFFRAAGEEDAEYWLSIAHTCNQLLSQLWYLVRTET